MLAWRWGYKMSNKDIYLMIPETGAVSRLSEWKECYETSPEVIHNIKIVDGEEVEHNWTFEEWIKGSIEVEKVNGEWIEV